MVIYFEVSGVMKYKNFIVCQFKLAVLYEENMPKLSNHKNFLIAISKFTKCREERLDRFIKEIFKAWFSTKEESIQSFV